MFHLNQNCFDYGSVDIRQPEMPSLELERQFGVVDTQAVQNGRMQVMHVDRILGYVVAVIVSLAVGNAGLDATACHPDREATRMVIAPVIVGCQLSLRVDSPPEFPAPDH